MRAAYPTAFAPSRVDTFILLERYSARRTRRTIDSSRGLLLLPVPFLGFQIECHIQCHVHGDRFRIDQVLNRGTARGRRSFLLLVMLFDDVHGLGHVQADCSSDVLRRVLGVSYGLDARLSPKRTKRRSGTSSRRIT